MSNLALKKHHAAILKNGEGGNWGPDVYYEEEKNKNKFQTQKTRGQYISQH